MELVFYLVFFGLGILLGSIIHYNLKPKCNHKWNLIEKGNIKNNNKVIGFYRAYECEHCLIMRKEQIEVD